MSRMLRPSLVVLAALSLAACGLQEIGDGHVVSDQRTVPAFSKVAVHSGIRAQVSRGERAVALTTDQNLLQYLETFVEGDTLVVRVRPGIWVSASQGTTAEVSNPALTGLDASGGAIVAATATQADAWPIVASGGSDVTVSGLQSARVTVDASGGSHVTALGLATDVAVTGSGGSRVTTDALTAENVTVDASGGSVLRVRATKSARGGASGGSDVTVAGNPAVRQIDTSGGSTVTWVTE